MRVVLHSTMAIASCHAVLLQVETSSYQNSVVDIDELSDQQDATSLKKQLSTYDSAKEDFGDAKSTEPQKSSMQKFHSAQEFEKHQGSFLATSPKAQKEETIFSCPDCKKNLIAPPNTPEILWCFAHGTEGRKYPEADFCEAHKSYKCKRCKAGAKLSKVKRSIESMKIPTADIKHGPPKAIRRILRRLSSDGKKEEETFYCPDCKEPSGLKAPENTPGVFWCFKHGTLGRKYLREDFCEAHKAYNCKRCKAASSLFSSHFPKTSNVVGGMTVGLNCGLNFARLLEKNHGGDIEAIKSFPGKAGKQMEDRYYKTITSLVRIDASRFPSLSRQRSIESGKCVSESSTVDAQVSEDQVSSDSEDDHQNSAH